MPRKDRWMEMPPPAPAIAAACRPKADLRGSAGAVSIAQASSFPSSEHSRILDDLGFSFETTEEHQGVPNGSADVDPGLCSEEDTESQSESESEGNDEVEEQYFAVSAEAGKARVNPVERDAIEGRCKEIRKLMRKRPTFPLKADGTEMTAYDVEI